MEYGSKGELDAPERIFSGMHNLNMENKETSEFEPFRLKYVRFKVELNKSCFNKGTFTFDYNNSVLTIQNQPFFFDVPINNGDIFSAVNEGLKCLNLSQIQKIEI